ncbi:hypothetical protein [Streptomyces griseosporeus]|uniref:hypothetical protein n=1 Tax=Streptomyces griseosporeus TaxID=1910 RepID=UPI0037009794
MIDAVAVTLIVVAISASLCGHAAQPFPPLRWWRALRAHRPTAAVRAVLGRRRSGVRS